MQGRREPFIQFEIWNMLFKQWSVGAPLRCYSAAPDFLSCTCGPLETECDSLETECGPLGWHMARVENHCSNLTSTIARNSLCVLGSQGVNHVWFEVLIAGPIKLMPLGHDATSFGRYIATSWWNLLAHSSGRRGICSKEGSSIFLQNIGACLQVTRCHIPEGLNLYINQEYGNNIHLRNVCLFYCLHGILD
jgi:hypothetical protein